MHTHNFEVPNSNSSEGVQPSSMGIASWAMPYRPQNSKQQRLLF